MSDLSLPPNLPPSFPPISELVPHEPPMLLVDELREWSLGRARVHAQVRASLPIELDGDRVPATLCLEYMAQAVAASVGMRHRQQGGAVKLGLLLGTRKLELHVDALTVGDELDIRVVQEFEDERLASYACTVERGGQLAAAATLNVMTAAPEELQP